MDSGSKQKFFGDDDDDDDDDDKVSEFYSKALQKKRSHIIVVRV